MALPNGVIFPKRMADFLTNPIDICFGSMMAESTTLATCLVNESTAVTTNRSNLINRGSFLRKDAKTTWHVPKSPPHIPSNL
jgi:hypothetical protein